MTDSSASALSRAGNKADMLERASRHCERREFTKALECFETLIRSHPSDPEVLCEFARRAHDMGAERLACGLLSCAARLRPDDADIMVDLSNAFVRVRSLANAEKLLERALSVDRENSRAHAGLVRLCVSRGEHQKAREHYERSVLAGRPAEELAARELASAPVQNLWRDLSSKPALLEDMGAEPEPVEDSSQVIALTARLLSEDECRRIVRSARTRIAEAATVGEGAIDGNARHGAVHWLRWPDMDPRIVRKLIAFFEEARRRFAIGGIDQFERVQVSRYDAESSGHFDWHQDSEDLPEATARKLSLALQLSPAGSYGGGELELRAGDDGGIELPRSQGCAVAFRSSRIHRVKPVTAGTRWSLVCWARGPVGGLTSGIRLLS